MIVALEGVVVRKEPTYVHLKTVAGITYKVAVSLYTSATLATSGTVSLHTTQVFREDAQLLFGFASLDEQRMFETLVKLSGIGPSIAMAVCSTLTPKGFAEALIHGNVDAFKMVPGIGPKSAKRILVELSDFSLHGEESVGVGHEASLALESLGFKKDRIQKVLSTCTAGDTAGLIKEALKKLS
ncbi:Holliday junction branch migration protein RuvA [Sulfurospirillum sp. T05]|uniref:Holliday junction branch migration complex subunit RuvA n=1 Tax=Sulfurospirillum tamanense TaxID=2813362 RepID=A0ABS2WR20_9BACT|nr:Holliday junction branch migration protein RuvA [Sulfurospirillum tamanensis]MBN2964126.1 Holliday junction branch migration protein RuvA [Sulfurospirillum tamanensis]